MLEGRSHGESFVLWDTSRHIILSEITLVDSMIYSVILFSCLGGLPVFLVLLFSAVRRCLVHCNFEGLHLPMSKCPKSLSYPNIYI